MNFAIDDDNDDEGGIGYDQIDMGDDMDGPAQRVSLGNDDDIVPDYEVNTLQINYSRVCQSCVHDNFVLLLINITWSLFTIIQMTSSALPDIKAS
tara:strand:+ start:342 stop:626 length:285 start_codon:yes stop_codon:yes gene_type:complete